MNDKVIVPLLKKAHLFIFLFLLCELAYGGIQYNPALLLVRKIALLLGIIYTLFYLPILQTYIKIALFGTGLLLLKLTYESLNRYGVWIESMNFMSQALVLFITTGCFVACRWLGEIKIRDIVIGIFLFYIVNQFIVGRIITHQFNSEFRSTSAYEAYYLIIPLLYFFIIFLQKNIITHLYYSLVILLLIILCFHRTVWITSIIIIIFGYWGGIPNKTINKNSLFVHLLLLLVICVLLIQFIIYLYPNLYDSVDASLSDIYNSDKQGTGHWRNRQRELYLSKIPEHPLLGWTYEGYEQGDVMADEMDVWTGRKGTFIHSGYIHALYNFGLLGLLIQYGTILVTLAILYTRRTILTVDELTISLFLASGFVFSWSYQLPDFYWAFLGVGVFIVHRTSTRLCEKQAWPTIIRAEAVLKE